MAYDLTGAQKFVFRGGGGLFYDRPNGNDIYAQVTNPPIDPIREELVMSTICYVGTEGNLLDETQAHAHVMKLDMPILSNHELEKLRGIGEPGSIEYSGPNGNGSGGFIRFGAKTSDALLQNPDTVVAKATAADVPLLYWTAASWGAAIALGIDRPDLAIDLPAVRVLAERALALDDKWEKGTLHELFITLDSLPEELGGNRARAREHFAKAVDLQGGLSPGPYVALATGVAVPAQDRAEFERLLKTALAIDPEKNPSSRLVTLVMQKRARVLLERIDEKFAN